MRKIFLIIGVCLFLTASKAPREDGGAYAAASSFVEKNEKIEDLAKESDLALDFLIRAAAGSLRVRGFDEEAVLIREEYEREFKGALVRSVMFKGLDLGDHRPLSIWLAAWYLRLEELLGPRVMEMTRLKDIKTFNFAIPVVFNPAGDPTEIPVTPWGAKEYSLHFIPFAGAVSYWVATGSCAAATWGAGWITFVCSYAGWSVEFVVMKRFAPKWSDRIYWRFNEE